MTEQLTAAVDSLGAPDSARDEPRGIGRWLLLALAAIVGLALVLVSARLETVRVAYALAAEERTTERLIEEKRFLAIERARARSPEAIGARAMERLDLAPPEVDQWVRWPDVGAGLWSGGARRWPW